MRGSREAPNWVWRARRGRWAKVPMSGGPAGGAGTACDGHAQRPKERMRGEERPFELLVGERKKIDARVQDQRFVPEKENRPTIFLS